MVVKCNTCVRTMTEGKQDPIHNSLQLQEQMMQVVAVNSDGIGVLVSLINNLEKAKNLVADSGTEQENARH